MVTLVQTSNELVVATNTTGNITFPSATTPGNTIIILVANLQNTGNQFTSTGFTVDKTFSSANAPTCALAMSRTNIASGSTTYTVNYGGSAITWRAIAFEVSGIATSAALETSSQDTDDITTAPNAAPSPGITTAGAGFIAAVFALDRIISTISGPSGWTSGSKFTDTAAQSGYWAVRVTSSGVTNERGGPLTLASGGPHYNAVMVAYKTAAASGPTITTQPTNQSVTAGTTATFTIAASASGGGTLSYQWRQNGTNISGATSSSYTTPATTVTGGSANNGDVYSCVVTETGGTSPGSVTSSNATLTVTAAAATATTLSGPSSGLVGVASTNFTVGANGTITGTVVVTPNDGGAGGTFTPTTVSISSGTPTGTFTYTPASSGAKTISTTNNGSLSNPTSITYTASPQPTLTIPLVNNTNQVLALTTIPNVVVNNTSTRAQALSLASKTSDSSGNLIISSTSLTVGVSYMVSGWNADGSLAFITQATAS